MLTGIVSPGFVQRHDDDIGMSGADDMGPRGPAQNIPI
jgi:hypothetical protein